MRAGVTGSLSAGGGCAGKRLANVKCELHRCIENGNVALGQLRPVERLQLGETAVIFVGERPRHAAEKMRPFAIRRGIGAERQRALAGQPGYGEPPAHHRGTRDHELELEAAGAVDLLQQEW